jgi:hypothetical protein
MAAKKPATVKETREKQLRVRLDAAREARAAAEAKINGASSEEIGCGDRPRDQCKGDEEAIREAGGHHL